MTDFRSSVPNISALARDLDADYSHLHGVLKGSIYPGRKLAKRIEAATNGAIRAVWLLELETPPEHQPSPLDKAV